MKRLIIDASSIIRACHYAGKDEEFGRSVDGCWINSAAWGFERFVDSYVSMLEKTGTVPSFTILVKDGQDSRRLRKQFWPEYKGKRAEKPKELHEEFNDLLDGIADEILSMGGTVMVQDGMEADDVIAYLATSLEGQKVIWSRDKDMLALCSDTVDVYLNDELNPEVAKGCPREFVLLYKAIVGDPSDNLPGATGFGDKAFRDLYEKFGPEGCQELENLIQQNKLDTLVEDVPSLKSLQKIIDSAPQVRASYACARFYIDRVNTPKDPIQIQTGMVQQWDPEVYHHKLKGYFGTKTLVTQDSDDVPFKQAVLDLVSQSPYVSLDIETSAPQESIEWSKNNKVNVDVFGAELTGLSLTCGNNLQHTFYFSVGHAAGSNVPTEDIKSLICDQRFDKPVMIHNTAFELPVLFNAWGVWVRNACDTMIMKSYVDENTELGLKPSSKQYFDYGQKTYEEVTQGQRMCELTAQEAFDYACDDTICTAALANRLRLTMELEKTWQIFVQVELPTQYWVAEAFINGVDVDLDELNRISAEDDKIFSENREIVFHYLKSIDWAGSIAPTFVDTPAGIKEAFLLKNKKPLDCRARLPEKIIAAVREQGDPRLADLIAEGDLVNIQNYLDEGYEGIPDFDVDKKAHLRELLYDVWKLPIRFRTVVTKEQRAKGKKQGTPSADAAAVEHALKLDADRLDDEKVSVLHAINLMCKVSTRRKLYYRPYPELLHWKDGKLHPQLGQSRAATRRFTPNAPNVNQLAKKGDGKKVRRVFPAPKGWLWVSMDESGQELRLAAVSSRDENLLSCYVGDNLRDPHSLTGAQIARFRHTKFGDYQLFEEARKGLHGEEAKALVDKTRDEGKGTNFSSQYLCRAPKLAKLLTVSVEDAQVFLDAKAEAYPGLTQWQQDVISEAHAFGYTKTLMGARRHLWHKLTDPDKWVQAEAERQGVNFVIQGSAGEQIKLCGSAMATDYSLLTAFAAYFADRVAKALPPCKKYGAKVLFPVHDEFDVLVPINENTAACVLELHACMIQQYADMDIPLESELSIGTSFGNLTKIGKNPTVESIETFLTQGGFR